MEGRSFKQPQSSWAAAQQKNVVYGVIKRAWLIPVPRLGLGCMTTMILAGSVAGCGAEGGQRRLWSTSAHPRRPTLPCDWVDLVLWTPTGVPFALAQLAFGVALVGIGSVVGATNGLVIDRTQADTIVAHGSGIAACHHAACQRRLGGTARQFKLEDVTTRAYFQGKTNYAIFHELQGHADSVCVCDNYAIRWCQQRHGTQRLSNYLFPLSQPSQTGKLTGQ